MTTAEMETKVISAPGVNLSKDQNTLVKGVLDLYSGNATKEKLQLWTDDAEFQDPLCIARGRKEFEAQWYGLKVAFSKIERLHQQVVSDGNPVKLELKQKYVIKGINKEQIVSSLVEIHTNSEGTRIQKLLDKWDGELPDSSIKDVSSLLQFVSPFWWLHYAEGWLWWLWSLVW